MNNNRGNNRRRGRGNNNRPPNGGGGGGGQQLNRIDSRARGNAPQLLEKYRKMAQDAHLNGDRVQAEYYLQFADHYFRVTADTRVRQEELRARQNGGQAPAPAGYGQGYQNGGSVSGDRWQDQDGDDDSLDFGMDSDFPTFDRAPQPPRREEREYQSREQNGPREQREPREQRPRPAEPAAEPIDAPVHAEGVRAAEGEPIASASDNPFIRDSRNPRGGRGRNDRNDRRGNRRDGEGPRAPRNEAPEPAPLFDPASLPPSIAPRDSVVEAAKPAVAKSEAISEPAPAKPARAPRTATAKAAPAAPVEAAPEPVTPEPFAETAAAPKKRGRPRKNPLPEAQPVTEG